MVRIYSTFIFLLTLFLSFSGNLSATVSLPDANGNTLHYKVTDSLESAILVRPSDGKTYQYVTVDIPKTITHEGVTYKVKGIGRDAFKGSTMLKSVSIPNTVTRIGGHAFQGCTKLSTVNYNANNCRQAYEKRGGKVYSAFEDCQTITKVNFGDDVTFIPEYLFWGCTGITEITIPENVTHISGGAFKDCKALSTVYFNAVRCMTMSTGIMPAFSNASISVVKFGPQVTIIPAFAFFGTKGITSITIPEQVNKIGGSAFRECPNLTTINFDATDCAVSHTAQGGAILPPFNNPAITTVKLGNKVTRIPDFLFWGCKGIQSIVLTENIAEIGESAFYGCSSLSSITIPESVEVIKGRAFGACDNLTLVNFNAHNCTNMTSLENEKLIPAFEKSSITQVVFGTEVQKIPDNAFADCSSLNTVNFPESIKYIGYRAFNKCVSLKTITIPESVEQIGGLAFAGCDKLTSIDFNASNCKGVTKIEKGNHLSAFQSLTSLKTISFGPEVTVIPDYIVAGCESLSSVVIPEKVRAIGGNAFVGCTSLNTVVYNAIKCDVSYSTNDKKMHSAFSSESITSVTFGKRVKNIPEFAFSGCTRLASITFPDSLVSIGQFAFEDCASLQKIIIPERVKHIKGGAFAGCANVRDITFNAIDCESMFSYSGNKLIPAFGSKSAYRITIGPKVKTIPDYAFYKCEKVDDIKFNKVLTKIGKFAFAGLEALTYIKLPQQLQIIGGGAFKDCSQLAMVAYDPVRCEGSFQLSADSIIYPFDGNNIIADVFIGSKVESIPEGMFYNCQKLLTLDIPKKVQQLGPLSFGNCKSLKTLNFLALNCENVSGKVQGKVRSAFDGCTALSIVTFNPKMQVVPDYLLQNCSALARVTLPEAVTRIGDFAFQNCKLLKRIMLPEKVTAIGEAAFMGTGITTMRLSELIAEIGEGAFANCLSLSKITLRKQNKYFNDVNGMLCDEDTTRLIFVSKAKAVGKVVLPAALTTIDAYAFYGVKGMSEIVMPEYLEYIGEKAFFNCDGLKKVWINAYAMPQTGGKIFTDYIKNAELIVAVGTMGDYMRDPLWRGFKKTSENYYDKKKFK